MRAGHVRNVRIAVYSRAVGYGLSSVAESNVSYETCETPLRGATANQIDWLTCDTRLGEVHWVAEMAMRGSRLSMSRQRTEMAGSKKAVQTRAQRARVLRRNESVRRAYQQLASPIETS